MLKQIANDGTPSSIVVSLLLFGLLPFVFEYTEVLNFGYSKFATNSKLDFNLKLPSKYGMLILYSPSVVIPSIIYIFMTPNNSNPIYRTICLSLLTLHFTKRCFECLLNFRG